MKKITHIGMAALVAMGMLGTSCNKAESPEIETPETQKENIVTLTTTVGFAADGTKALTDTGVKTFAVGETMALCHWNTSDNWVKAESNALKAGDIADGSKSATFTFTLTDPKKSEPVVYIYPAAIVKEDGDVDNDALFNNQDGTLAKLSSTFDYSFGHGAWNGDNLPSLTLENELAILAITLTNADGSSDITSSITGLTLSDGTKNYTKTLTGKTYAKGNGYPVSWRMAPAYPLLSAATTSDYGKVVCADGHLHEAKTAVPTGCTAVGILGKVTETGHGLILALKDATSQYWTTINGWTSETTYAGTTLKVLPDDAARGTNLTSYTALGTTAVSNWAVAQKSDYEAIFTNLGSTTGDGDSKTYDANVNAYITTGVGGTALSGDYWSATEIAADRNKWNFNSVSWYDYYESTKYSVRPVLGFGGEAAPAGPTAYTLAESTVGMIVGTDGKAYWQYMFVGCTVPGDASASEEMDPIAGFKAKIAATGITWKSGLYWSSTKGGPGAWIVSVNLGDSSASATFAEAPPFPPCPLFLPASLFNLFINLPIGTSGPTPGPLVLFICSGQYGQ